MFRILRFLFFQVIVRFLVLVMLGVNVRHRQRLPQRGPAILVANHNSHLDTLVLMALLPPKLLSQVRPVAAMEYFLRNRVLAWFALNIIGILPLQRQSSAKDKDPFVEIDRALEAGSILIFFPEGTRGEPERLAGFKRGIAHLAQRHPAIPVTPVFLHGLGKALPKGESLLVPFFCDVFVGDPQVWGGNRRAYMRALEERMHELAEEGQFAPWE